MKTIYNEIHPDEYDKRCRKISLLIISIKKGEVIPKHINKTKEQLISFYENLRESILIEKEMKEFV